jgi:hypothetical protein
MPSAPADLSLVEELFLESNSNLARHGLLQSSTGINSMLKKIEEARQYIDADGFVPQGSLRFLPRNPGPNWLHTSNKEARQKALDDEKAELQTRKPWLKRRRGAREGLALMLLRNKAKMCSSFNLNSGCSRRTPETVKNIPVATGGSVE